MIRENSEVNGFVLLNPLTSCQEYVAKFDKEGLQEAIDNGLILMVEYRDQTRDYVTPDEIAEFVESLQMPPAHLVSQEYFVPITEAMFKLLEIIASYLPMTADDGNNPIYETMNRTRSLIDEMLEEYKPNLEGNE